eukprot:CAMPEP_0113718630 /NCGR_PEP_ID=MMETSP0038_2-20120614/35319_1 /TAXON_ID=2898 /ORGANISM="Cryptomonas paramecium" /LENGTH=51 /DNA_ID=CAMNT_0000646819 /DNA_START=137 /DNA_END=288 /DNA_ORIENTATION=+ /assembly_acc=CAM_ASM_000170
MAAGNHNCREVALRGDSPTFQHCGAALKGGSGDIEGDRRSGVLTKRVEGSS